MKKVLLPLAFLVSLSLTPDALAETQTREVAGFQAISSQGVYKLLVKAGQKQSLTIDGPSEEIAKVKTSVSGETLSISTSGKQSSIKSDRVTITVNVPTLKSFRAEGVGSTELTQISGEQLEIYHEGVGSITASGEVKRLVLNARGVGSVSTRELSARQADVSLEGVGTAEVKATESLIAKVDGIGSLTYYGKPQRVVTTANGIGSVHPAR